LTWWATCLYTPLLKKDIISSRIRKPFVPTARKGDKRSFGAQCQPGLNPYFIYSPKMEKTFEMKPNPAAQPRVVKSAVRLLYFNAGVGVLQIAEVTQLSLVNLTTIILLLGVNLFFIFMIRNRYNWSRYGLLLFCLAGTFPHSTVNFSQQPSLQSFVAFLVIIQSASQIIALILLFLKPSSRWFTVRD